jgi:hypothetical protein
MTDTTAPSRAIGILSIATGVTAFALLAGHPGGEAHSFAEVLKNEAADRVADAVVHGGFIAVLALQTICYARLKSQAGLILFAFGTAFLSASMLLDGLVTPALAARYLAAPDKIEYARSLFVLVGTLIGLLMPIGLAFQSAAIAWWGASLWTTSRFASLAGLVLGGGAFAALGATAGAMNPLALMGAVAATSLWAIVAGIVLLRR